MNNKIKSHFKHISNTLIELKQRIVIVIFVIIVFRVGLFIPIPGINNIILSNFLNSQKGTIVNLFNMFSGGALSHSSIFSLGIMPYITASIIMQFLTLVVKKFSNIKKEGELGFQKIKRYTRYLTLLVSIIQSFGIAITLPYIFDGLGVILNLDLYFYFTTVFSLCTGTMLLMWLGELITTCGIGNGTSIIIFLGIISKLPVAVYNILYQVKLGNISLLIILLILLMMFFITFFVVFIESSYRKIFLQYSSHRNLQSRYIVQKTHLPFKINMSGVIPAIFASSIIIILSTVISWFGIILKSSFFIHLSIFLKPGQWLYMIIYSVIIILFCFIYSMLSCKPKDVSDNLKKSNVFIPNIRPGLQTTKYISNIMIKLILINSFYIITICLVPEFIHIILNIPFYFGGTSLLIVVVVILDFINQFQTLMISNKYNNILKKSQVGMI